MKNRKQYAEMNKQELETELASEDNFRNQNIFGKKLAYIMAPVYAAPAIYNFATEDNANGVKWLFGVAFCLGAAKLFSYWRKKSENSITEIKSAMGNLEARVE